MMLVTRRALDLIVADLSAAADACAGLVERHRGAIQPGRTLLQQALPITFGLKAAEWLAGLDGSVGRACGGSGARACFAVRRGGRHVGEPRRSRPRRGRRAGRQLRLPAPDLPWHTIRLRPVRIASALGAALGVTGKIGRDVVLLAQTEVAEVVEGGGAGTRGLLDDAAQAQPGRRDRARRVRAARPRSGGDDVRGDDAGARARRRAVAGRVGDVAGAAAADRVGGGARSRSCSPDSR